MNTKKRKTCERNKFVFNLLQRLDLESLNKHEKHETTVRKQYTQSNSSHLE